MGIKLANDHPKIAELVHEVKHRETQGYAYEGAEASFELLVKRLLGRCARSFLPCRNSACSTSAAGTSTASSSPLSEATIKLSVEAEEIMAVAEGNGPVNALDTALRKALIRHYPKVKDITLTDYKVRILTPRSRHPRADPRND